MDEGLRILEKVKAALGVPVLTDVHDVPQIEPVAKVVDVLQTPAFLARQTDFIRAVAASGKPVNIKKAQFMAPHDMKNVVDKARNAAQAAGVNEEMIMVCERGASFGYNNLVSDMRSLGCERRSVRWCSTQLTASSFRAGRGLARAASVSSFQCLRVRRWRPGLPDCLCKRTPIPRPPNPTDRTPGRSNGWRAFSRLWWISIEW
jgi:3-deoxy-8-phosphooctulonate synthase